MLDLIGFQNEVIQWVLAISFVALGLGGAITIFIRDARKQRLLSFVDAVQQSQVIWGLWLTGGEVKEWHIQSGHIKRILILKPDSNDKTLKYTTTFVGDIDSSKAIEEINNIVKWTNAVNPKILRHYDDVLTYSFTIFDPKLIGNYEDEKFVFSGDAWVVVQVVDPKVRNPLKRRKYLIRNRGNDKERFVGFYELYKEIWNKNANRE